MPPPDTSTSRRALLAVTGAETLLRQLTSGDAKAQISTRFLPERFRPYWTEFRERFLRPDGRIIDTGNGDRSHSEGQGWGMLFATEARDREAFERILRFTLTALRRPQDGLFRWLWLPGTSNPTPDDNNATDGDVYICWALLRAADLWDEPGHAQLAREILRTIETTLLRQRGNLTFLLPGVEGFEHDGHWTLNPSYGVLPAWRLFARHGNGPIWRDLTASHLRILSEARFGRFGLPPDWLRLTRGEGAPSFSIAPEWPPRFSYDAVRVPLLLAWDGHHAHPSAEAARRLWAPAPSRPAWIDLETNALSPYPAAPGIIAIGDLLAALATTSPHPTLRIASRSTDDYYSSALRLLCVMAANHQGLGLVDA